MAGPCSGVPRGTRPAAANRSVEPIHGDPDLHDAPAARGWRPFRPPDAALESQDGAVSVRCAQRRAHHRPDPDRALALSGAGRDPRRRRGRRPDPVRRHQAPGPGAGHPGGQAVGPVLCQPPLARRHVDQLEDDLAVDPPPARAGGQAGRRHGRPDQEGDPAADPRARQARAGAGRHQGHGRPARPDLRGRHQQGGDRDRRGQGARHPGGRRGRQQLGARGHRLSGARQRRRLARDQPLLRSDGRRGARRHPGRDDGIRGRSRRDRDPARGAGGRRRRRCGRRGRRAGIGGGRERRRSR